MTFFFGGLRIAIAVAIITGVVFFVPPTYAGLFDDNEARQAVLDLRAKADSLLNQLSSAQHTILDQLNYFDQMSQQIATLRGQNEDLAHQVSALKKQERYHYTDLDVRLKKLEFQ
ncbi:YbgF trimerization domain-containing protein [Candidatus Vallotia cooleyia]|jgi:chromosome segregation ATPase|uniref:YbgF trimerization domain-containing protein n=1 Tax=Candidatus Vallotiella adelgis TaxID=1177211 RepID=UPI002A4E1F06|nr:YbgF trimerization domain-containing protein [Candidatus Vallotia cooleyia]